MAGGGTSAAGASAAGALAFLAFFLSALGLATTKTAAKARRMRAARIVGVSGDEACHTDKYTEFTGEGGENVVSAVQRKMREVLTTGGWLKVAGRRGDLGRFKYSWPRVVDENNVRSSMLSFVHLRRCHAHQRAPFALSGWCVVRGAWCVV